MENCCQGLGKYGQVLCQGQIHHFLVMEFILVNKNVFHVLFLLINKVSVFMMIVHDEYGHMGLQSGLSFLLDEGEECFPEEGLCFWMYLYFY